MTAWAIVTMYHASRALRGRVVKVVDFKQLAPHRYWFESRQGLLILSCEEAIPLAYETSMVLLRSPFVTEIMHGRAPEGPSPSVKLERRHLTYVSVWRKTQSNKQTNHAMGLIFT
jgi:hypothetical protein